MTNVVIYCRTSTRRQKIHVQRDWAREYCDQKQYTVVAEFLDNGYGGDTADRPAFHAMFNRAFMERDFDRIVVVTECRFSRMTAADTYKWHAALERLNIALEVVNRDNADLENLQSDWLAAKDRVRKAIQRGAMPNLYTTPASVERQADVVSSSP